MNTSVKILFADDDIDDRKLFEDAVKEIDDTIEFYATKDGLETINFLFNPQAELPNYIFLDLSMPKMNGRQCLQQIRESKTTNHIPVIVFTTSTNIEDETALLQMGANHFLSKPVKPQEFYYVISHVLNEKWNH